MTQYNSIKQNYLPNENQQQNPEAGVTLRLSSNLIGNSNNEANFSHKLLLPNRQVSSLCQAFAMNSSANVKSSKTQLSRIIYKI